MEKEKEEDILYSELPKEAQDFMSNTFNENGDMQDMVKAEFEIRAGLIPEAVATLCDGVMAPLMIKVILDSYEKARSSGVISNEELKAKIDTVLAAATALRMAYQTVEAGIDGGTVYFDLVSEKYCPTASSLFLGYTDADGLIFLTVYREKKGNLIFHTHYLAINPETLEFDISTTAANGKDFEWAAFYQNLNDYVKENENG